MKASEQITETLGFKTADGRIHATQQEAFEHQREDNLMLFCQQNGIVPERNTVYSVLKLLQADPARLIEILQDFLPT